MIRRWLAVGVVLASICSASACPVCDSGTGRQVRAGIMDDEFGRNLLATVLPFPLLLGVVAWIHFGSPVRRKRTSRKGGGDHDD